MYNLDLKLFKSLTSGKKKLENLDNGSYCAFGKAAKACNIPSEELWEIMDLFMGKDPVVMSQIFDLNDSGKFKEADVLLLERGEALGIFTTQLPSTTPSELEPQVPDKIPQQA